MVDDSWRDLSGSARNSYTAVSTTSVVVLPANPRRRSFALVNSSANDTDKITLNFGDSTAVADYGLLMFPRQAYSESDDRGFLCFKGAITAICATTTGKLSIMERSY